MSSELDTLVEPFGKVVASLNVDPQHIAVSLHDATRQCAVDAFAPHKPEFEALELETTLWDLVVRLSSASQPISKADMRSLVTSWAQQNLNQPQEPANLQSLKWMYTRSQAAKPKAGIEIVTEMDPDAPLRQVRAIADEDRVGDDAFFKYVFELLLAGQIERARSIAADTNNWLVRAALGSASAQLESESSPSRDIVFEACRELSATSQLSRYEAGVFGLLCHNLDVVVPLCESWETLLLAHLLCGASLEAFERQVKQDHKIALQGKDWRRQIALALIQGRFSHLVDQLLAEVSNPATASESALVQTPWLMRVLLHIQIALSQSADALLVQVYIEYLCEDPALLASRLDLAPVYAELLTGEAQTRVYGRILAQITDPEEQTRQIELARKYELDLESAIDYALELNFELYAAESDINRSAEDEVGSGSDASPEAHFADLRLVGVLYWPVAAELWPTAARALVRAYALLLANYNRRQGAILITSKISAEYVRSRVMDGIRAHVHEHPDVVADLACLQQYAQLGSALSALDAWHSRDQHVPGWRSTAPKLIGHVIDTVSQALQFAAPSSGLPKADGMSEIRSKYIPRIVFELLEALRAAEAISVGYANVALEFAVKIADDNLKLYELFDETLLEKFAEPALRVGV